MNTRDIQYWHQNGYAGGNNTSTWTFLDPGSPFEWTSMLINNGYTVNPYSSLEVLNSGST
jgi:hypothetical protein